MDLLDRYLQAVRFWLPAKQKHDIIAELSEDLHSQIDENEAALGRPLNEDEQVDLLKRLGPPTRAAFYSPRRCAAGGSVTVAHARRVIRPVYNAGWLSSPMKR